MLIVVSVVGAAAWGFHRLTRGRIARWGKARQHYEGLRIQHLQQGLGGAKDVTLLGRETDFLDQYRAHNAPKSRSFTTSFWTSWSTFGNCIMRSCGPSRNTRMSRQDEIRGSPLTYNMRH
jgi:hypothetical protein